MLLAWDFKSEKGQESALVDSLENPSFWSDLLVKLEKSNQKDDSASAKSFREKQYSQF